MFSGDEVIVVFDHQNSLSSHQSSSAKQETGHMAEPWMGGGHVYRIWYNTHTHTHTRTENNYIICLIK